MKQSFWRKIQTSKRQGNVVRKFSKENEAMSLDQFQPQEKSESYTDI